MKNAEERSSDAGIVTPGPCQLNPTYITVREHFCKAELRYAECHIPENKGKNTCPARKLNQFKAFTQMTN